MNAFGNKSSALLVLVLAVAASESRACGEVMFRTAGAVRYHAFTTHHPAAVLLYTSDAPARHGAENDARIHDELEHAGHKVAVAHGQEGLARALAARSYDVLIVNAGDMDGVMSQLGDKAPPATLIPVFDRNIDNERALRERFPRLIEDDADINDFLKIIEHSMKGRGV